MSLPYKIKHLFAHSLQEVSKPSPTKPKLKDLAVAKIEFGHSIFYVDYVDDLGTYGVFDIESGFCYATLSKELCQRKAYALEKALDSLISDAHAAGVDLKQGASESRCGDHSMVWWNSGRSVYVHVR